MNLFPFKKKPSLSFVFDIRDTFITIAAVKFEQNKKPELVLCQNFEIKTQEPINNQKYLSSMISTFDKGIISLRKSLIKIGNKEKIDKLFFFIGSPWCVSQSKMIKIIKDRPFEINKKFLEKIINTEENDEKKEIEKIEGIADWGILEEKIIQSKLNGYKIDQIFGKKASDLEIELFVSFVPREIKDKLSFSEYENFQKHALRHLNSCILSSYSFLRDLYSDKNDFIYIDIGDIITDAYIVKNDVVYAIVSVPFGRKEIIRSTSVKTKMPEDVLLSALHINYSGDYVNSTEKIEQFIGDGVKFWLKKLNESILKVCTEINVPKNVFIIINNELANILIKEIENNKESNQSCIFNKDTEIVSIGESVLNDFITNGKIFKNEPYVKMDLVFLDKILKQNNE